MYKLGLQELKEIGQQAPKILTKRYVVGLSLVALLTIAGHLIIQYSLHIQKRDAHIINLAGRQRMLAAHISKDKLAIFAAPDSSLRKESSLKLLDHLNEFITIHNGLQKGDASLGLPGTNNAGIRKLFLRIRPSYRKLVETAEEMERLSRDDGTRAQMVEVVGASLRATDQYIEWMERIVELYESEARARIDRSLWFSVIVTVLILVVLSLEMLLIFRPGVRQLTRFISSLIEASEHMETLSIRDGLTGIYNWRYFDETVRSEWLRSMRQRQNLALILLDIDHFKLYNDTYGHLEGDQALIRVAKAVEKIVRRPADTVARYGGEEFIVILPDTDLEGARYLAEKIRRGVEALAIPHRSSETASVVTVSLGVTSMIPDSGSQVDDFIEAADQALYQAKGEGRNRVERAAVRHESHGRA